MIVTLIAVPVNVVLNYAMIFGKLGFPAMGGVGAGYASALTHWLIFAIGAYITTRKSPFADYKVYRGPYKLSWRAWAEQLRIGIPLGLSIALEVGVFSVVGLLMSRFGTLVIAAHQSAISFGTLIYMFPLSVSQALTIVVGFEVGARRIQDAIQYRRLGMRISLTFAAALMAFLWFFSEQVARLYTADPELLPLLQSFLGYVIFFQLSDAVAAPIQGTLRGYKDVNVVLALALVAYWVIGLPVGYSLATWTGMGPYGYWIGLISGLASGPRGSCGGCAAPKDGLPRAIGSRPTSKRKRSGSDQAKPSSSFSASHHGSAPAHCTCVAALRRRRVQLQSVVFLTGKGVAVKLAFPHPDQHRGDRRPRGVDGCAPHVNDGVDPQQKRHSLQGQTETCQHHGRRDGRRPGDARHTDRSNGRRADQDQVLGQT